MRKLKKAALVVAAAGGLTSIGAGISLADAPLAYNGAAPPPVPQSDTPQAATWSASQATSHASGSHGGQQQAPQAAEPQRPAEVSPQVNPQLNPQLSPVVSQVLPQSGPREQNNLFRPYQECSPQTLLDADLPIGVLAAPQTSGITCTQANTQANAFASAH
ncbi:hypothetical protein ACWD6P_28555 [Streptomyces sp. NPDC002446]